MKKFVKILSALLLVTMLMTSFVSCGDNGNQKDNPTIPVDTSNFVSLEGYTVVYPRRCSKEVEGIAHIVTKSAKEYVKTEIKKVTDNEAEKELEILIGETNRKESTEAYEALKSAKSEYAYVIKYVNNKIVIVGLTNDDTVVGVRRFLNECVENSQTKGYLTLSRDFDESVRDTGEVIYFSKDYHAVVREKLTTIRASKEGTNTRFTYGKIIKLEHQADEKNNGILFATNENTTNMPWDLYQSNDDGETWKGCRGIYNKIGSGAKGYQPFLYELPADMGEYKKGTILFTACLYTSTSTEIILQGSTNLCESWQGIASIAKGNGCNQGGWSSDAVWEPTLIYEESTGRMYCFYSDELEDGEGADHVGGHNQRIVYRYSTDLKNWSETYSAAAFGELRPGMVSITSMGEGGYAFTGETGGKTQVWCHFQRAETLDSWDASNMEFITAEGGLGVGGSPGLTWTPNGGKCGTLFLVGHHAISGSNASQSQLFISFDYGETFEAITNPIPVNTFNGKVYNGYSCGFFTAEDGSVYYVNNVELSSGASSEKLMMAKLIVY